MASVAARVVVTPSELCSLGRGYTPLPGPSNGARIVARLGGTKKVAKKVASKVASKVPTRSSKKGSERPVWFPGAEPPEWLDGSLPGDRGFDPLGLAKPPEYLQFDLDGLDQNLAKNQFGDIIGAYQPPKGPELKPTPFVPYTEAFSLTRFRENEVIHGRWAMLGVLGALAVEGFTGITWYDAGKVELEEGSQYFGFPLPFSISALVVIEVLVIGYIEFLRNAELDPEKRLYPGGAYFDPLGLASDPVKAATLKEAEVKHARLAMVAALGFAVQAAVTGKGPLDNFLTFLAATFSK